MSSTDDGLSRRQNPWVERLRARVLGEFDDSPVPGQPVSALIAHVWSTAFKKRVHDFVDLVIERFDELDARVDNLEVLLGRDLAVSAGIEGARAAGRAYSDEKIELLANAVVTIAADSTWDDKADYAMLLLRLTDELTVTHIRVLSWIGSDRWDSHLKALQEHQVSFDSVLMSEFANIELKVTKSILADLIARNLVVNRSTFFGLSTMNPEEVSSLGSELLNFLSVDRHPSA